MAKKYEVPENEPQMLGESVATYGYSVNSQHPLFDVVRESPNLQKKEFLRTHLHSSTAEFLESVDWMENKPFPMYSDSDDDETWIDMAEAVGYADVVDDTIVNKDRQAWLSLR